MFRNLQAAYKCGPEGRKVLEEKTGSNKPGTEQMRDAGSIVPVVGKHQTWEEQRGEGALKWSKICHSGLDTQGVTGCPV